MNGEKTWPGLEIISTEMQYCKVPDILLIFNQYYNDIVEWRKALLGLEINSTEMQYRRVPDILLIINQYYNNIVEWRKSLAWDGNHFYRDAISQSARYFWDYRWLQCTMD